MLYKMLICLGLSLLILAIVLSATWLQKKNIKWSPAPLVENAQSQCVEEPSMKEATHQLIQGTWQAHLSEEGSIPMEQCLLFIKKFLSQKDIERMQSRRSVHLVKTSTKGGKFQNRGDPITLVAVINGEKYEITIPETFKGVYEASEDRCRYFPHKNTTIVVSKRVYYIPFYSKLVCKRVYYTPFYAKLEGLDAQQTALDVYFDNKDSNICF